MDRLLEHIDEQSGQYQKVLRDIMEQSGISMDSYGNRPVTLQSVIEELSKSRLPLVFREKKAAEYVGIEGGEKTLQTYRRTGRVPIPFIKIGKSVYYRRCDLDNFINNLPTHVVTAEYQG